MKAEVGKMEKELRIDGILYLKMKDGETEQEAISRALDLLDTEISLSNRNVTYNVFEVILKDEYL